MLTNKFKLGGLLLLMSMPNFAAPVRDTININRDWLFHAGEGDAKTFTKWSTVNLPHDFQVSQPWVAPGKDETGYKGDEASNVKSRLSARGFKEMGAGWYKKTITPNASWKGKRVLLDFQGIMLVGDVYLNGERIGGTDYGYVGFDIDISKKLRYDASNELLVYSSTGASNVSRWYTGGGLFRDVNLIITDAEYYFPRHPLYITTPKVSESSAEVNIQAEICCYLKFKNFNIAVDIFDPTGKNVASKRLVVPFNRKMKDYEYQLEPIRVSNPKLWSCEEPNLYTAQIKLLDEQGNVKDSIREEFGIRTIEYSPDFGFKLNGKKVLLKGFANHHSLGALGAAAFPRAIEKRIKLMKQFGYNHIRTSHNPYSEDFLKLCDRYGIIVVDELYDKWLTNFAGGRRPWTELWQYDVPEFVKRDRNHPCVVMWSLGNELQTYANLPYNDWGVTPFKLQRELLHRYDTTRPTTVAMHPRGRSLTTDSIPAPLALVTDIAAYNYRYMYFPGDARRYPNMIFYQSEANTSNLPANFFEPDHKKVVGSAYWGAIDYLGESNGWPAKGWAQGVFDISLEPKPIAYLMKSMFTDIPTVHIGVVRQVAKDNVWNGVNVGTAKMDENWNLQEGQKVSLNTYTNAEEVELFVNGKSYGTKKNPTDNPKKRDIIKWDNIEYHAGTVEAVAKSNGKIVARHKLTTTGEAVKLIAMPDQQTWHADGKDLLHIRVVAVDSKDRRVPTADTKLKFNVEGNAEIIAVSNGDITSDESLVGSERSLYQGSALVILRSTDKAGKIVFTATGDKLTSARLKLVTK